MLTIDTIPLWRLRIVEFGLQIYKSEFRNHKSEILFAFPVHRMAATATAEFFEFQAVRRVLLVLCRHVITLFALGALQNYVISRHITSVDGGQPSVVSIGLF